MIGAIILNLKSDGFIVAGAFLLVSLILGYLLESSASVEGYAIYAFGELLFIHIIHSQIDAKTLVSDMINLSRLSIVVQLLGAVAWIILILIIALKNYDQPRCHRSENHGRDCDCGRWLSQWFRTDANRAKHCSNPVRCDTDKLDNLQRDTRGIREKASKEA